MNFEHDNHSGTDAETKRPYDAPTLVRYGDLDELTHATTQKAPIADTSSQP